MADSMNPFSFDVYSGKINLNPLDPSSISMSQMQYGMTSNPNINLLNIEAEKNVLNTAITPESPEEEQVKVDSTQTLVSAPPNKFDGGVNVQLMSTAEKTQVQQVDVMQLIQTLKKDIARIQGDVSKNMTSEFEKVNVMMNQMIASTQEQYSPDPIISASDQKFFFDLKLAENANLPEWV